MNRNEQIWLGLFCVLPFVGANALADTIAPDDNMKMLYAAMFGGFGAILGYGIYHFTKHKSNYIKGGFLLLLIAILTTTILIAANNSYPKTCQVCGYKAIEKGDPSCGECFEELSDKRIKEKGYNNLSELVYSRQLYFFYDLYQDSIEKVDFYKPPISEEGYKKDLEWKPLITKEDLLDIKKGLKEKEQQVLTTPKR